MKPAEPDPVKLFCGILYHDELQLMKAISLLIARFGEADCRSPGFDFSMTDYYDHELGSPVYRIFISFSRLVSPGILPEIKIATNAIEDELTINGLRKVNLDPGYMDYDKVVLASAKYNGQKIYLDKGIWADLTLHFEKNQFDPYPWSFPDFKKHLYDDVFLEIRRRYKEQMKEPGSR
jgi:hypothetical protein